MPQVIIVKLTEYIHKNIIKQRENKKTDIEQLSSNRKIIHKSPNKQLSVGLGQNRVNYFAFWFNLNPQLNLPPLSNAPSNSFLFFSKVCGFLLVEGNI